jgi:hypothetical protein
MDEDFAFKFFRKEQGPLFARDALQTVVLTGDPTYRRLLREAGWISALYPRAYSSKKGSRTDPQGPPRKTGAVARMVERVLHFVVGGYLRGKARMLNQRLSKSGQFDSIFVVRSGQDHLMYESERYLRIRRMYSSSISRGGSRPAGGPS